MTTLADEIVAGRAMMHARFGDGNAALALGPTYATGDTISTKDRNFGRANTAGNITGVLMTKGDLHGQIFVLANTSANTIVFASAATSFVSDGANITVQAGRAIMMIWSAPDALWYAMEGTT